MNTVPTIVFDPRAFAPEMSRHEFFAQLRETSPATVGAAGIHLTERSVYLFTRALCEKALLHPDIVQAPDGAYQEVRQALKQDPVLRIFLGGMLFADPPEHTKLRRPLQPLFSGPKLAALEDRMVVRARELARDCFERGGFDAVQDFAVPFVVDMLIDVMGMPPVDPHWLKRHSEPVADALDFRVRPEIPEAGPALAALVDYSEQALREPAPEGSVFAVMKDLTERGEWTHDDFIGSCILFLNAGQETVIDGIGNAMLALEEHPEKRDQLRGRPDLAGPAGEELLRFAPPVHYTGARIAAADVEINGVRIGAGESVVAVLASANRDPAWIDRPDDLDFERQGTRRSMAFGTGLHTCIGQHLARLEMKVMLQALYVEAPRWRLDTSGVRHRANFIYRGLVAAPAETAR